MPVTLEINHERQEARATASGSITMADIEAHLGEIRGRNGLPYRELIDASEATVAFTSEDVRRTAEILRDLGDKSVLGPTAVIVSDDLAYGMMRMLGTLVDDVCQIRPYRKSEGAM